MKKILIPIIFFCLCGMAFAHGNGLSDQWAHNAPEGGCTNAFYIDTDCDGYGVGYGVGMKGPDADDHDATVNTSANVISKYGTMEAFIKQKMQSYMSKTDWYTGSSNGGINRFIVLDYTNGNNATGAPSTSLATALKTPYQFATISWHGEYVVTHAYTYGDGVSSGGVNYLCVYNNTGKVPPDTKYWVPIKSTTNGFGASLRPGDCIVVRGGNQPARLKLKNGTTSNPMYLIPYPGEQSIASFYVGIYGMPATPSNIVVDGMGGGFVVLSAYNPAVNYLGAILRGSNVIIREVWKGGNTSSYSNQTIECKNILYERIVFGGREVNHTLYLTGHYGKHGSKYTVRGCIFQSGNNAGFPIIQLNGGVDDFLIENNIFHSYTYPMAISILDGSTGGIIRKNVFFNGSGSIIIYWYQNALTAPYNIACTNIDNIQIINNTFYMPAKLPDGSPQSWQVIKYTRSPMVLGTELTWTPNTVFAKSPGIIPTIPNGCAYRIKNTTGTRTSGATEPTWPTKNGGQVTDGTINWYAYCDEDIGSTGHVIRNNNFLMEGTSYDSIITFDGMFPSAVRSVPAIDHNVIYRVSAPDTKTRTMGNKPNALYGKGSWTYYNFEDFETFDTAVLGKADRINGNIWANPNYVWTDPTNDWTKSGQFDLHVKPGSLAIPIHAGAFTEAGAGEVDSILPNVPNLLRKN